METDLVGRVWLQHARHALTPDTSLASGRVRNNSLIDNLQKGRQARLLKLAFNVEFIQINIAVMLHYGMLSLWINDSCHNSPSIYTCRSSASYRCVASLSRVLVPDVTDFLVADLLSLLYWSLMYSPLI